MNRTKTGPSTTSSVKPTRTVSRIRTGFAIIEWRKRQLKKKLVGMKKELIAMEEAKKRLKLIEKLIHITYPKL